MRSCPASARCPAPERVRISVSLARRGSVRAEARRGRSRVQPDQAKKRCRICAGWLNTGSASAISRQGKEAEAALSTWCTGDSSRGNEIEREWASSVGHSESPAAASEDASVRCRAYGMPARLPRRACRSCSCEYGAQAGIRNQGVPRDGGSYSLSLARDGSVALHNRASRRLEDDSGVCTPAVLCRRCCAAQGLSAGEESGGCRISVMGTPSGRFYTVKATVWQHFGKETVRIYPTLRP